MSWEKKTSGPNYLMSKWSIKYAFMKNTDILPVSATFTTTIDIQISYFSAVRPINS